MALTLPIVSTPPVVPEGTVYFVRHGLVNNPNRIAYGWLPRFGIVPEGREQAQATAGYLATSGVVAIFTSPLLRAMQTAHIIAAKLPGVPVRRMRLLIESGLARHWQGTNWAALEQEHPDVYRVWQEAPSQIVEGESMQAMANRMQAAMAKALRLSRGGPAICVSHRDPIVALRLAVSGCSFDELHRTACTPASVTIIRSNAGHLSLLEYREPHSG